MTNSTSIPFSNEEVDELLKDSEENSEVKETGDTKKQPGAFRTISEVAEEIHVPQHVLRFWETRFKQLNPLKRSGGRRYYRVEDIALLQYISELLYTQGYTIKGVQRLLDEDFSKFKTNYTEKEAQDCVEFEVINQQESEFELTESADVTTEQLTAQSVADALLVTRLKEENKLLIHSLQTVVTELRELRKLIATEY